MLDNKVKNAFKEWVIQLLFGFALLNIFLGFGYILIILGVDIVGFIESIFID